MGKKPQRACTFEDCPLFGKREVAYFGDVTAPIVYCAESPGKEELVRGEPLVGDTGKKAKAVARKAEVPWSKLFLANSARCLVNKKDMSGKAVTKTLACCRPKLVQAIGFVKPKLIIAAGDFALRQILRRSGITKHRGKFEWSKEFDCWVLPMFHPAYILRNPSLEQKLLEDFQLVKAFMDNDFTPPVMDEVLDYQAAKSIREFLDSVDGRVEVAFDTETQGKDWSDPNFLMLGYSLSWGNGQGVFVRLYEECTEKKAHFVIRWPRAKDGKKKKVETEVKIRRMPNFKRRVSELRELLENPNLKKRMMNGNYDLHTLDALAQREGLDAWKIRSYVMDIQAAAHVIDENLYKMSSLDDLQRSFTNYQGEYNKEFNLKYDKADMLAVPPAELVPYACADSDVTLRAGLNMRAFFCRDANHKQAQYFVKFLQPVLQGIVCELERNGAHLDRSQLPKETARVEGMMNKVQAEALKLIKKPIRDAHEKRGLRLTRKDLIRDALFDADGFDLEPISYTAEKQPRVNKESRMLLSEKSMTKKCRKFMNLFDEFSELHTLWSRYLKGMAKHIKDDGRIHSNLSMTTAVTGRMASSNPNVMNMPKRGKLSKVFRRLVTAAPGYLLMSGDEGQSELRWLGAMSGDPEMARVFNSGEDIHTNTAQDLVDKPWGQLSATEIDAARRKAKCFHPDTEVLTGHGWTRILDLQGEAILQAIPRNGKITLEWTTDYFMRADPNHFNYLVHLKNEGIDLRVTPDHRMLGQRSTGKFHVTTPDEFVTTRYWHNAGLLDGGLFTVGHDLLRLAVATQADGSYMQSGGIRFEFTKSRKVKRLKSLLDKCGVAYTEKTEVNGVTHLWVSKEEGLKIKPYLGKDKTLPWSWIHLTPNDRNVVLEEAKFWDAHKADTWRAYSYMSTVKKNADVLQALAAITERKTRQTRTCGKKEVHNDLFRLTVRDKAKSRGGALSVSNVPYRGVVAVLSVPSSFVLVRDGESEIPVVTGQSTNFGLAYLMTVAGFIRYAKRDYGIDVSYDEAKSWIDAWFGRYSGITKYHEEQIAFCRKHGYVESVLGRRRHLPEIWAKDSYVSGEAERMAVNHPIQNPSSDVVLMAGNEVLEEDYDHNEFRPILFIHDELVWEVRENADLKMYAEMFKHHMENPPLERDFGYVMPVPLVSDVKIGKNLAEMELMDL